MGKSKKNFYAVSAGRKTGIFTTWTECELQVKGFAGARFKGFKTREDADEFISSNTTGSRNATPTPTTVRKRTNAVVSNKDAVSVNAPAAKRRRTSTEALKVHIMFDGGSRGNPGVAGSGATIIVLLAAGERRTIHMRYFVGTNATNNEAEYLGLVQALKVCKTTVQGSHLSELVVQGDSQLVIKQLQGKYQVKNKRLIRLFTECKELLAHFCKGEGNKLILEHVYREGNREADDLANQAMDARRSWMTTSDDGHIEQLSLDVP